MGKWITPRPSSGPAGGGGGEWHDPEFAGRYPALAGWMSEAVNEGGAERATGTFLLFCDGPVLKVCLRDRESGCFCFLTAKTILGAFQAAEDALFGGDADWRASNDKKPGRR